MRNSRKRKASTDPEQALINAIIACANVDIETVVLPGDAPAPRYNDNRDAMATLETHLRGHPWVQIEPRPPDPDFRRHLEPKQFPEAFRVVIELKFVRDMLRKLIEDPLSLRGEYRDAVQQWFGRRFVDLLALARGQDPAPDEPRIWKGVCELKFERVKGFRLEMRPLLTSIEEALLYGLGMLLDERRGFSRRLAFCHSPRSEGQCGRIFTRSMSRQHFCSARCARRAAKRANVMRQQRYRASAKERLKG
jgi:hypothetical protein